MVVALSLQLNIGSNDNNLRSQLIKSELIQQSAVDKPTKPIKTAQLNTDNL